MLIIPKTAAKRVFETAQRSSLPNSPYHVKIILSRKKKIGKLLDNLKKDKEKKRPTVM